jgi:hypothetical protein
MAFDFRIWPAQGFEPYTVNLGARRPDRGAPVRHGPRLVARWQRGTDGHLECRWSCRPD